MIDKLSPFRPIKSNARRRPGSDRCRRGTDRFGGGWINAPSATSVMALATMLAAALATSTHADADWVELSSGGVVDGDVADPDDRRTLIRTNDGIVIAVSSTAIRRRVKDSELTTYAAARKKAGVDSTMNQQLARWCRQRGNLPTNAKQYRDFHLRRVVHAEPKNAAAWATLGYKPQGNRFVPVDQLMRDRGLVRTRGGWEMPEVAMAQQQRESDEVVAKTYVRDIARLVQSIQRGGDRGAEAVEQLRAIDDPLAALGMVESLHRLGRSKHPIGVRPLRQTLLTKIVDSGSPLAVRTLVQMGIDDPDPILRETALSTLADLPSGRSSAVATYLPMLKSNNNSDVNRAAAALASFPDPELDLTYVDALVTQHKQTIAPGAGLSTTFGGGGPGNSGGGLSTGGKARVIVRNRQNPAVLSLLRLIAPSVNYSFNETAWRNYFVSLRTRSPGDLRSDPQQ